MTDNKLENSFGPAAISAGYFFLLAGAAASFYSYWGILLIVAGIFIAFTHSGIRLDTENRKLKYYSRFFWVFEQGKWQDLNNFDGLALLKNRSVHTAHSRSNRTLSVHGKGYIIYLVNIENGKKIPLTRGLSAEDGKTRIKELSSTLKLSVVKNR